MATDHHQLPLSLVFDELMRDIDHYISYNSDNEFLDFVLSQEECRKKWYTAEQECTRLQGQLQLSHSEIERQEKKIQDTRRQLEIKLDALSRFEREKTNTDIKLRSAITLINSYLSDIRVGAETKERLSGVKALLEGSEPKKVQQQFSRSPGAPLDTISEAETTDLSMTQSEDDLDVSNARTRNRRAKRAVDVLDAHTHTTSASKRRKSGQKQTVEMTSRDQLVAQTTVTISRNNGPIHAVSTVEAYSGGKGNQEMKKETLRMETGRPQIAYGTATSESESDTTGWASAASSPPKQQPAYNTRMSAARNQHQQPQTSTSLAAQRYNSPSVSSFGRTLSNIQRNHVFVQKTVFKPETCEPCGKRIKFNKTKFCCRDCKATCHPECKDKVPTPCVPASTPGRKNKLLCIADYTPQTHPMVPALIQHCVNEVEARGMKEVGLYRVPGPEKDVKELVKDLKERFLRGKGVPNLARYDIETICGCIKNFLRSLEEPIVGRWFWHDFAIAADLYDPEKRRNEIQRIINDLPPPNQDTLAFMILHLRKISRVPAVKMTLENFAKIFGPTIIGYSCQENQLDSAQMLQDTKKQQMVMEIILNIEDEYWRDFIYRPSPSPYHARAGGGGTISRVTGNVFSGGSGSGTPTGLPTNKSTASLGGHGGPKKIYFTDDSPSPSKITNTKTKKTYFD